jgi:hypothetical protein
MLEDLGNIGDFVGGIAVILTLLYLAVGLRQNTAALNTASRQEIVRGYREANVLWLQPGVARAYARGLRAYPDMPYDELNTFVTIFNDQALFFQGVFALHESRQLEEETYRAYLGWFAMNVSTPGGTRWWDEIARPIYTPRMVAAVDARVVEGNLPDLIELHWMKPDDQPA